MTAASGYSATATSRWPDVGRRIPDFHLLWPLHVCVRTHGHVLTFMDVSAARDSSQSHISIRPGTSDSLMLQCTGHALSLSYTSILNDCASNPMAHSAMDPYSGSASDNITCSCRALRGTARSVLCSYRTFKGATCSRVETSFDGTVGYHMSIVVNRVQREIVCFSFVPNRTTTNTVLSSFFATLTKLHFNGHFPTLILAV